MSLPQKAKQKSLEQEKPSSHIALQLASPIFDSCLRTASSSAPLKTSRYPRPGLLLWPAHFDLQLKLNALACRHPSKYSI